MKFFHVYNERSFKGLETNNMLNKDSGFKIQHIYRLPQEIKFNELAKKGGKLHSMIKENNIPFYVDRIAGGTVYHYYKFDKDLVDEYKNLLGDWFLGFQLHESGSNRKQDWDRIVEKTGSKGPHTKEQIYEALKSNIYFHPDGTPYAYLSQEDEGTMAKLKYPETHQEFIEDMTNMFKRRMVDSYNNIIPCDSYYLASKIQNDMGMNTFMPEVGCQIAQMRVAVALARGMANIANKTWGVYYECWRELRGVGYCMPCFNNELLNEWYNRQVPGSDDFTSYGINGGSSRILQDRIYNYALMAGADYFSEEWGLNCSYSDMFDFTLSDYGKLKKQFIDRAVEMRGVKAKIPFAIVLPNKYSCIEIFDMFHEWEFGKARDIYLEYKLTESEKEYFGHIENVLKFVYAKYGEEYGNEGHVMSNSRFGDLFDIVYEDADEAKLSKYDYLIDATPENAFIKAKEGSGLKILSSADFDKLGQDIERLARDIMPVYVNGLHWVVSTDEKGRNFLTIFNNEGNERCIHKGDIIHDEADRVVKVEFKNSTELKVLYDALRVKNAKVEKVDDKTYNVLVPAAGYVILEF